MSPYPDPQGDPRVYVLPTPLEWQPTPNQSSRQGAKASLVVVHRWAGGTYPGVIAEFKTPAAQASAHIVYAGETGPFSGKCAQMVPYEAKAWTQYPTFNLIGVSVECADAMWLGQDHSGFHVAARIVAFLCHHIGVPAVWVHGEALLHRPHGFTRHYDLGALGGGHTDPTTSADLWQLFVEHVHFESLRGGFRKEWGRDR